MGTTTHGIKYSEPADVPNVPDDIGGIQKLNQTTQAWLAQLDTTNSTQLASLNGQIASAESTVSSTNASITTAVSRQSAQQASINSITTRNNNAQSRLDTRDTGLGTIQSGLNGFTGQISSSTATKGRGCLGHAAGGSVQVPFGSRTPFASITFNDPAPNTNRVYRASFNIDVAVSSGYSGAFYAFIALTWASGTSFPSSTAFSEAVILDGGNQQRNALYMEQIFTGVTFPQWTLWAFGIGPSGSGYFWMNNDGVSHLLLEDIGLQL